MAATQAPVTVAQLERRQCRQTLLVTRHCPQEMRGRSTWSIDQFVVAKKLGGGYASTVHLAVCKASGIQVAIKIYHRCKLSQLNHYQVKREVRIHSGLDHPNVLRLYAAFEDEVGVYLITEFASRGDVFGELDRRGGTMSEGDAVRQVLLPFMSALRYLHALDVIHRDIKPENLLMNAAGELKVADFGLSIDVTRERPVTRVGTLDYMAPEVVVCPDKCPPDARERQQLHYTHLVDAWAVGVLAYELTVGRAPFDAGTKRATIDQILNGAPSFPTWVSEQARHFITWSLTKDVRARPDVAQLAYHPWVTSHAAAARPRPLAASARAMSMANLQAVPGGASDNHTHMEARHKALVAGHVGGPGGLGSGSDDSARSEEDDGAAAAARRAAEAAAAAAATSPFAAREQQQQAAPSGAGGSGGVLECAAEHLRAYVHRCQSANNLDSLRAAVLMQPPEPSNACFEPGGRFYNARTPAPAAAQQPCAAAAALTAAPQQPAAAAGCPQQQQPRPAAAASRGSASSSGGGGSPKPRPSGGAGAPPLPPAGPARPAPLQLVRMPSAGSSSGSGHPSRAGSPAPAAAEGDALAAAAAAAAATAACAGVPPACAKPPPAAAAAAAPPTAPRGAWLAHAPVTPEPFVPPRLSPYSARPGPGPAAAVAAAAAPPPAPQRAPPAAALRGSGSGGSEDGSLGSPAAGCGYPQTSAGSASCSDGGGCGSRGGSSGSGSGGSERARPRGGAGAAAAAGAPEGPAKPAAPPCAAAAPPPPPPRAPPPERPAAAAPAHAAAAAGSGGAAAASWFGLQCLNLLKPSKPL